MKTHYRGFELEAKREKCLGGYPLLYFTIYSNEGREWVCNYEDSDEKIIDKIDDLKKWVNEYYEDVLKGVCPDCLEEMADIDDKWYCKECDEHYNKTKQYIVEDRRCTDNFIKFKDVIRDYRFK